MSDSAGFFPSGGFIPKSIKTASGNSGVLGVENIASNLVEPYYAAYNPTVRNAPSGACTAGVLRTILSITGAGCISYFGGYGVDATSRTHRLKLTFDGTVVLDATSAAITLPNRSFFAIGCNRWTDYASSAYYIAYGIYEVPLYFNSSLLVEYASSLTETDKTKFGYRYYLR
jgi:hypothetical protein